MDLQDKFNKMLAFKNQAVLTIKSLNSQINLQSKTINRMVRSIKKKDIEIIYRDLKLKQALDSLIHCKNNDFEHKSLLMNALNTKLRYESIL